MSDIQRNYVNVTAPSTT